MIRNISIRPVLNGFVVTVGCQELAYSDRNKMLLDLTNYLIAPELTEKRILEQEGINASTTMQGVNPTTPPMPGYEGASVAPDCCAPVGHLNQLTPHPTRGPV